MSLWRDKVRGDWRYRFEVEKKTYAAGGFSTKSEARAAREERRKQVKATNQTRTVITFSQIANQYLDWSEKRHVKKTYEYKQMVYREFLHHQGDLDIHLLNPSLLHSYLNTRPSAHNYNVHRKELCALFSFAIKHLQVMDKSPCWNLEKLPEEKKRRRIPTNEEFLRIMAAAGAEEKPLLIILTHTLARIDEILRLRWEDVNFSQRVLTLWTRKRKGGNWEPRYVPVTDTLHGVLWPMWNRREQQEWVFFNRKEGTRYNRRPKLMRSICNRAGVSNYGFHSIRHFTATLMHDAGKIPTGVIGGLLGHQDKRTTEVYLHSVEESARNAMQKLDSMLAVLLAVLTEKGGKKQQAVE